jgi:hypothetical protein
MANIHDVFKEDDVNGFIVGSYCVCAQLKYDGRDQGQRIIAADEDAARQIAEQKKQEIRNDLGQLFEEIYPDDSKWRVVFYR